MFHLIFKIKALKSIIIFILFWATTFIAFKICLLKPNHLNWLDYILVGNNSKLKISNLFKTVADACGNLCAIFSTRDSAYQLLFLLISISSVIDMSFSHKDNLEDRSFLKLFDGVCLSSTSFMLNNALSMAWLIREKFNFPVWKVLLSVVRWASMNLIMYVLIKTWCFLSLWISLWQRFLI